MGQKVGAGVSELEFNVPFQHKHGYIRDEKVGSTNHSVVTCLNLDSHKLDSHNVPNPNLNTNSKPNTNPNPKANGNKNSNPNGSPNPVSAVQISTIQILPGISLSRF